MESLLFELKRIRIALFIVNSIALAGRLSAQVDYSPQIKAHLTIATPTKAPCDCDCKPECKCQTCLCMVKPEPPVVSVKKVNTPAEASVLVTTYLPGGRSRPHTGTAICEHTVVTCAHGFDTENGKTKIESVTVDGKPAKLISIDFKEDVALLRTEHAMKHVEVATVPPKLHERVVGYGFEQERQAVMPGAWRFTMPVIGVNEWRGLNTYTVSMRAKPGRSGGGLFNAQGQLVGVCKQAVIEYDASIYAGLPAIRKLVYGDEVKLDASKYASPDFLKSNYPVIPDSCPGGNCQPQKKAAPSCASGNCNKAPAMNGAPSEKRMPSVSPSRGLFIRRGR